MYFFAVFCMTSFLYKVVTFDMLSVVTVSASLQLAVLFKLYRKFLTLVCLCSVLVLSSGDTSFYCMSFPLLIVVMAWLFPLSLGGYFSRHFHFHFHLASLDHPHCLHICHARMYFLLVFFT